MCHQIQIQTCDIHTGPIMCIICPLVIKIHTFFFLYSQFTWYVCRLALVIKIIAQIDLRNSQKFYDRYMKRSPVFPLFFIKKFKFMPFLSPEKEEINL